MSLKPLPWLDSKSYPYLAKKAGKEVGGGQGGTGSTALTPESEKTLHRPWKNL